ncbi:hypothetical protein [Cupriavidus necator]|uniref:hypothetical protein n=1 Tax=Cupriavidus necator TaxID=106590 RepID=UPI0018AFED69|nr:hypothetical protein [Cupriavidus necator]
MRPSPVCTRAHAGAGRPLALARGHLAVAGVDIVLLMTGGLALAAARRLRRVDAARQARIAAASGQTLEEMDRANHA